MISTRLRNYRFFRGFFSYDWSRTNPQKIRHLHQAGSREHGGAAMTRWATMKLPMGFIILIKYRLYTHVTACVFGRL